jgi:hypothetical protein
MSIVASITQSLTPNMLGHVASLLGAPQGAVKTAMTGAVPALLAAMLSSGQNKQGADAFAAALAQQTAQGSGDFEAILGRDARGSADAGGDMLSSIIGGGRLGVLASKLRDYAGLPEGTSGSLLGLAGALSMRSLGATAREKGLDAGGMMQALAAEKGEIARALPADFARALDGAGLLDSVHDDIAALAAPQSAVRGAAFQSNKAQPSSRTPAAQPVGRPWWHWVAGVATILVAAWLLSSLFGGTSDDVVEETVEETTVTTVDPATSSLAVAETEVAAKIEAAVGSLTGALAEVTDAATAEKALPALTSLRDDLTGLQAATGSLSDAGRAAVRVSVTGALPELNLAIERQLQDGSIAAVLKPVLDEISQALNAIVQA